MQNEKVGGDTVMNEKEVNPRHRSKRLEQYVGKKAIVEFKGFGGTLTGVLEHHGWRYGMKPALYTYPTGTERYTKGWYLFCHSHVKSIEEVVDGEQG